MTKMTLGVWAAVALVAGAMGTVGCGSVCAEVQADRAAFEERKAAPHAPDARLALPFPLLDQILAQHLAARPPFRVELPLGQFGIKAAVDLKVEGVTMRRERPGRVGFTATLGLFDRPDHKLATINIEAAVAPEFEAAQGEQPAALVIRIRPRDLGQATPTVEPGGREALAEWVGTLLPPAARILADRRLVGGIAEELLGFFARELWPSVRERVLGTEPLVDTRIELGGVPARAIAAETQERRRGDASDALVVLITTSLPVDVGLPADPLRIERARATLRLTGQSAAELVNLAMQRGELPSRFDTKGHVDPNGPWEARAGWRVEARPLKLNLWQTSGTCKRASLGAELDVGHARPQVSDAPDRPGTKREGPALAVHVTDAHLESLQGPSWLVAFAWLDAAFSDALDFTFRVAAIARLAFGVQTIQLAVDRVVVDRLGITATFLVDVAH